jgi:predicted small metal-binding protein
VNETCTIEIRVIGLFEIVYRRAERRAGEASLTHRPRRHRLASHREEVLMSKKVECPCGTTMCGKDDDELVANVEAHVREKHPAMTDSMTREKILSMASQA